MKSDSHGSKLFAWYPATEILNNVPREGVRLTEVFHEHLDVELQDIHTIQHLHNLLLQLLLSGHLPFLWHLQ